MPAAILPRSASASTISRRIVALLREPLGRPAPGLGPPPAIYSSNTTKNQSERHRSEQVIAVITHGGAILLADDEGYTHGTMLAPNRMELCYLHVSTAARIASCTELTKQ